ncbi:cupin-like domain-containing protein [Aureococcus anophagefferens]|nr:cupin-like domain-containing protein [Aureococcus anophagefferens]
MLAPHSAGSSESARKMASHGSFQSLGSAKSEPAEWLPNRWGESYRLGDLGADQAPEGPAAKPRTFAEFRPEESRPGWLGGVATPPREVSDKIRHALDRDVGPERLRRFLDDGADGLRDEVSALREENRRLARENARLDAARRDYSPPPPGREPANPYDRGHPNGGAPKPFAPPRQTGEGYDGGDAPNFDAMREDLHGALSLDPGRPPARAPGQDRQARRPRIVATKYYHRDPETVTEISALRGQLIALAHSIDKLDQRTLAIESDAVVTIDGVTQPPQRGPGGA